MKKIAFVFGTCILFLTSSYGQHYLKDEFSFIHDSVRSLQVNFLNFIKIESLNFDFKREFYNSHSSASDHGQLELVLSASNSGPYIHTQLYNGSVIPKFEIAVAEFPAGSTPKPVLFYQF